ncbi:MAG TPA: hypothetical protein VH280_13945 [Verrucomicrobiae bacterium]|jgi:hypothetical protein|nr:hypothetical protein [Verrucomicrobiae bacterium]
MKRVKIIFVALFALIFLACAYFAEYRAGKNDDDRLHLHLNIDKDVYLYRFAERGDITDLKSSLGFFTLGDYNFYEAHYGSENWSSPKLETAREIATVAATNGSVIAFTNY